MYYNSLGKLNTPQNDQFNFFCRRDHFGSYTLDGYLEPPNYPVAEVEKTLNFINSRYKIGTCCQVLTCICFLLAFGSLIAFMITLCVLYWLVTKFKLKKKQLRDYLTVLNAELLPRNVHWEVSGQGFFLHLCTNYPMYFNPKGLPQRQRQQPVIYQPAMVLQPQQKMPMILIAQPLNAQEQVQPQYQQQPIQQQPVQQPMQFPAQQEQPVIVASPVVNENDVKPLIPTPKE